jgi:hypothetical protein
MLNVGVCQMTGAMTPVGGPLHSADTRLPTQAKKKLIAMTIRRGSASRATNGSRGTLNEPHSKLAGLPGNVREANKKLIATLPNSKICLTHSKHSAFVFSNRNKSCLFVPQTFSVPQWLFTLSGTEGRGQSFLIANQILESTATRSKQTVGTISNREKSTALHNRFHESRITNHQSLLTIHGLYDTFLRGAKQNWRNSIYA